MPRTHGPRKRSTGTMFEPSSRNICINCGQVGSHFIPPMFGLRGAWVCENEAKVKETAAAWVKR